MSSSASMARESWELADMGTGQTNNWSCGIHSSNRMLNTYGKNLSYQRMISEVGPFNYMFPFSAGYTKLVEESICSAWGTVIIGAAPCIFWDTVEKEADFHELITLNLDRLVDGGLGIGKPTKTIALELERYGLPVKTKSGNTSIEDIKSLIDQGKPVMTLIQNGNAIVDARAIIPFLPQPYSFIVGFSNVHIPGLHWIVINGYDSTGFKYYNTGSGSDSLGARDSSGLNESRHVSFANFQRLWGWNHLGYKKNNNLVHDFLRSLELDRNTILWFDEALPEYHARQTARQIYYEITGKTLSRGKAIRYGRFLLEHSEEELEDLVSQDVIIGVFTSVWGYEPSLSQIRTLKELVDSNEIQIDDLRAYVESQRQAALLVPVTSILL